MFKPFANKILLAASALLMCAAFAQAQTTPASPLTATWAGSPSPVALTYQLGGSAGSAVTVTLTIASGSGDAFAINAGTVPSWLSLSAMSGTAVPASPGPAVTISFNAGAGASALLGGVYTANVGVSVTGYQDLVVPVSLAVSSTASTLSVMNGSTAVNSGGTVILPYTFGSTTFPTATLTLLSSDDPIAFTLASAVTTPAHTVDWIQVANSSGIAYNYGTQVSVTFLPGVFQNASVGQTLQGTLTISYGSSTYPVNFSITVAEPNAAITSIFPQETPPQSSGPITVVVSGSGFGTTGGYSANPTVVSITYGPAPQTTAVLSSIGGAVSIPNQNTLVLTIPYQDNSGSPVEILSTTGTVTISATNGLGGETAATWTLNVSSNPIIYSVIDAAALEEPAAGAPPNVAPYEIISIFGSNFCPSCTAPVVGTLTSSRYPTTLTAGGSPLTVSFYKSNGSTLIAKAYLLFANNTQINALVPSTIAAADDPMQIVVSYNSLLSNTNVVYKANAVTANPGIFTLSSSGQGQGAILLANYSVNSSTNKAATGSTVLIYVSGLGTPTSTAKDVAATSAAKFPGSCVSLTGVSNYITVAGLTNPATADGAVIQPSDILTNLLPPCFATSPTVSIGGKNATVTYAGWVSDSVAGLYQINATVPTTATAGNAVPVTVTIGGVSSQAGVTMAIQ